MSTLLLTRIISANQDLFIIMYIEMKKKRTHIIFLTFVIQSKMLVYLLIITVKKINYTIIAYKTNIRRKRKRELYVRVMTYQTLKNKSKNK